VVCIQPWVNSSRDPILKTPITKKGARIAAQVATLSSNPKPV
jgi:hypothetical protein